MLHVIVCPVCQGKGSEPNMMQTTLTFTPGAGFSAATDSRPVPCFRCRGVRLMLLPVTSCERGAMVFAPQPLETMRKPSNRPSRN